MKARTFSDTEQIEVELKTSPSSTGLVVCQYGDAKLVRHRNQLEPLDDEARQLLGK